MNPPLKAAVTKDSIINMLPICFITYKYNVAISGMTTATCF